MRALLIRSIPVLAALAGGLALVLWLRATPGSLEMRLEAAGTQKMGLAPVEFRGEDFRKGSEEPVAMAGSWPCFRGEDHSGVSREEIPLTRTWGAGGPKPLWEVPVGIGYAAPAIRGGLVYLLDYDEAEQADVLRCLSLATGKEVWRRWYKVAIDSDHGISRTVPAVNDQYVVTIGPKCHVLCCDSKTGDLKWGLDMADRYQTQWPKWYAGQCPLIDMDKAILAPAGKDVLMVAVECETGKVLWKTPNPRGWKMTHSSIVPMDFKEGWRMYVYCGSGGVVGVAADDAGDTIKAGDILWEFDQWRVPFANVPSPVMIGDGRILLSGGYGAGSMMIQITESEGKFKAAAVWRLEKSNEFGSEQQTPIFYNGMIYGVLPKEAGGLGGQMVCLDLAGQHVWESGRDFRFGLGPWIIADGLIYAMNDDGVLTMAEATSAGFKSLGSAKVLEGHETWAPMAVAGGRLIVRDLRRMVCLDVRKE